MVLTPEHKEKMRLGRIATAERRKREREDARAILAARSESIAESIKSLQVEEAVPMGPIVHEGAVPAVEIVEPDDVGPQLYGGVEKPEGDDFEMFLAEQDEDTRRLLTVVELRVIYETGIKRIEEEKKAAARKAVEARALRRARVNAGMLPAEAIEAQKRREWHSQKVKWTVNMPEAGNSGRVVDAGVRINGRLYVHGEEMTGTLDEYISYRSIEARAHENEQNFQGRGKLQKLRQTATGFINMKGASL